MSYARHTSIDCIKELVLVEIILWIEPFFFQLSPHYFSDVQVRRIGWQKENIEPSFLPIRDTFSNDFCLVKAGIIQHHKGFPAYLKRELLHKFQYKLSVNSTLCGLPPASVLSADKPQTVDFVCFFRKDADFFIRKLPTVWNIAFTAYMSLIAIIQVNFPLSAHLLQFIKFLYLKTVKIQLVNAKKLLMMLFC